MFKKLIFASVLIAFIGAQLVYSLDCWECHSLDQCRNPSKISCNQLAANRTTNTLSLYHQNVQNKTSNNFNCLSMNYTQGNLHVMQSMGCVNRETGACGLTLKNGGWSVKCYECSGNYCNGSPAGTYSSSFFTMIGSAFILLIAKFSLF